VTYIEMTKLCAEGMSLPWLFQNDRVEVKGYHPEAGVMPIPGVPPHAFYQIYDPLTNDAQAMALVKRFALRLIKVPDEVAPYWLVAEVAWNPRKVEESSANEDLNRAIVETVAKMQAAKVDGLDTAERRREQ
jgi:hypothetical protein